MLIVKKTIALASEHAGFDLKGALSNKLACAGFKIHDLGTNSRASVDYSDYGYAMADTILNGNIKRGVLICGSGIGMSIAANRFPGIRAALVSDPLSAKLCRQHNDANILCLGARLIGTDQAEECVQVFIHTKFQGGRHRKRILKLSSNPKL